MIEGAAHDHDAAGEERQARLGAQSEGQVRQRRGAEDRRLPGVGPQLVQPHVHGGPGREPLGAPNDPGMAEAAVAVGLRGGDRGAAQRGLGTDGHLDVGPAGQVQDRGGVEGAVPGGRVAARGGDGRELGTGAEAVGAHEVEQGAGIVDAGVDVGEEAGGHGVGVPPLALRVSPLT